MIKTRINGTLVKGTSVVNIFGKLLKRPLHQIKDNDLLMVDIQKILLKKRYKNYEK